MKEYLVFTGNVLEAVPKSWAMVESFSKIKEDFLVKIPEIIAESTSENVFRPSFILHTF